MTNNSRWDPASVKAQLRLTTLRLGQLQEKKDSQGAIIRRDIATLLQQGNFGLSRAKAQNLQREDELGDLLEVLEMHVGQLLEHFNELDLSSHLTPSLLEAISTVMYAAPYVGSKDLDITSDLLKQHLGPEFTHSAVTNHNGHVAPIAIRTKMALPPSAQDLNFALQKIASEHGASLLSLVSPQYQKSLIPKAHLSSTFPVYAAFAAVVYPMSQVGFARVYGSEDRCIQDLQPTELVLRLFFGVLPTVKASWAKDIQVQRDSYYDLTRRLLDPLSTLPLSTSTTDSVDVSLLNVSEQLSAIPFVLFGELVHAPGSFDSCPLDETANDRIRLKSANILDTRLGTIRTTETANLSPASWAFGTRPDSAKIAPEISLSSPDMNGEELNGSTTTLLSSSKPWAANIIHPKHLSALRRLLYLHASINPGNISPHIASLLVPLYTACNQEVVPEDLAHAEADTFWLFEAMVGEFSELEDEEGGSIWMKRFSERLAWADSDLFNTLGRIVSVSLLAHPHASKLNYDRLGKNGPKSPGLWTEEKMMLPPPSPLRAWELGDAFLEGVGLLEHYPVEAAGGIDRILQDAIDLCRRREEAKSSQKEKEALSLSARIKFTMWKGFTNQVSSPDTSPGDSEDDLSDDSDGRLQEDGNDTETPVSGLTSRLANTVWRGITNQTSMEPPPSPNPPLSPSAPSAPLSPSQNTKEAPQFSHGGGTKPASSFWSYADKLKDSDTVAVIAKASSNWRAKSILSSWSRSASASDDSEKRLPSLPQTDTMDSDDSTQVDKVETSRPSSLLVDRSGVYSPPPRRHYFRPPRDSFIFPDNATLSPTQEQKMQGSEGLLDKTRSLQLSLAAITRTSPSSKDSTKSGPRPLLLNPSTSLTSPPSRPVSRSAGSTPAPDRSQWADIMGLKGHSPHRESMSSVSSLSPSDALRSSRSNRSDWDSDTGTSGRRIPLNRKSISPMAPSFRARQTKPTSAAPASSPDRGLMSPPLSDHNDLQSWSHMEKPDSPVVVASPPSPKSPKTHESRSRVELTDSGPPMVSSSPQDLTSKKPPTRKILPATSPGDDTSDSSVVQAPPRSPRLRSKRYTPRPLDLNLQDVSGKPAMERKPSHSNSLGVDWPSDDHETATTPRASSFKGDDDFDFTTPVSSKSLRRSRKASTEAQERLKKTSIDDHDTRVRKLPSGQRSRKLSSDQKEASKRRESSAEEGDDEGYDDLLTAYESENSQASSLR
ncbi:hypothetical protein H0H87_000109 [Tephrocybe sp. NHM501043]|nr:hypothetical protein H0H87_000109 [Tephrocybe sp. NHM501043]